MPWSIRTLVTPESLARSEAMARSLAVVKPLRWRSKIRAAILDLRQNGQPRPCLVGEDKSCLYLTVSGVVLRTEEL